MFQTCFISLDLLEHEEKTEKTAHFTGKANGDQKGEITDDVRYQSRDVLLTCSRDACFYCLVQKQKQARIQLFCTRQELR